MRYTYTFVPTDDPWPEALSKDNIPQDTWTSRAAIKHDLAQILLRGPLGETREIIFSRETPGAARYYASVYYNTHSGKVLLGWIERRPV